MSLLAVVNQALGAPLRAAVLFAAPVCLVAWHSLPASFVIAALAVLSAWIGNALADSASAAEPLSDVAMIAFLRLSVLCIVASVWARVLRRRRGID